MTRDRKKVLVAIDSASATALNEVIKSTKPLEQTLESLQQRCERSTRLQKQSVAKTTF